MPSVSITTRSLAACSRITMRSIISFGGCLGLRRGRPHGFQLDGVRRRPLDVNRTVLVGQVQFAAGSQRKLRVHSSDASGRGPAGRFRVACGDDDEAENENDEGPADAWDSYRGAVS